MYVLLKENKYRAYRMIFSSTQLLGGKIFAMKKLIGNNEIVINLFGNTFTSCTEGSPFNPVKRKSSIYKSSNCCKL